MIAKVIKFVKPIVKTFSLASFKSYFLRFNFSRIIYQLFLIFFGSIVLFFIILIKSKTAAEFHSTHLILFYTFFVTTFELSRIVGAMLYKRATSKIIPINNKNTFYEPLVTFVIPCKNEEKSIAKTISKYLKEKMNLNKNEIQLFTVKINGKTLINNSAYINYLTNKIIEQLFQEENTGFCSLCGKDKEITANTTRFNFKFYMTDKIGFASGLDEKGFYKNYKLCKDCYKKILAGEKYIWNKFKTRLGKPLLVIPEFLFSTIIDSEKLDEWSEYITYFFNSAKNIEGLKKFENRLKDFIEYEDEKNNFILNLLFYEKGQDFKILHLIKDIPPSRIDILKRTQNKIHDIGIRILGGKDTDWYISLEKIYYLFPIRISKGNPVDYKKILEFYDALFTEKPISYHFLIKQFVGLSQVYRFERFNNYNIKNYRTTWESGLTSAILEANLLLLYLRNLEQIEGGEGMNIENLDLKGDIKNFILEMRYSEEQTALFLLGYLIGEIGNVQYSKDNPSKPILRKITYQGMDKEKVLRLVNEIFEKLDQYKSKSDAKPLRYHNEKIFGEMMTLFGNLKDKEWQLTNEENVYYILSGYAFATYKAIKAG